MRQAILAAAFALAACESSAAPPPEKAPHVGRLERLPDNSGSPQKVFSIDTLAASCTAGALSIQASASTNSGGWKQPELRRLDLTDGVVSYEVVAMGPGNGPVSMMLQMFAVQHKDANARGIKSVRVIAESNEMTVKITGCPV